MLLAADAGYDPRESIQLWQRMGELSGGKSSAEFMSTHPAPENRSERIKQAIAKQYPGGVPENPLKARWLGIYAGAGIHGTDVTSSLGTAASHGCIRMAIPDVVELYDQVPVSAPVYIA